MGSWDSNATCWVVDRNHQFYDALTWVDDLDSGTIPFTNIATMVSACQRNTVQFSRAIDYLETAYERRSGAVYGIKGSFLFTALHPHPRFKALLRKMNLA